MSNLFKRTVPVILVLALFLTCLVSPASAVSSSSSFNLLNYASADDSGSNYISFSNSTDVSYKMPYSTTLRYVDMLITFNGALPTSVSVGPNNSTQFPLTLEKVSGRLYRVYGSMSPKVYHNFVISITTGSSDTSYVFIHEINLNPFDTNVVPTVARMFVYDSVGGSTSVTMSDPDDEVEVYLTQAPDSTVSFADYTCTVSFTDWLRFDSIDILLYIDTESINSVIAKQGDLFLDHSLTFISPHDQIMSYTWVMLHVDLSSCDHDSTDAPQVCLTGTYYNQVNYNKIRLKSVSGIVNTDPPSEFLSFWYNLRSFLTDRFSSLSSSISAQTTSITSKLSQLDSTVSSSISAQTTSIISRLSQFESNVSTFISDQTEEISSVLADFKQEFISQTVALKEYLGHKLDNIRGEILAFKATFDEWMVSFQALIREIFGFDDTTAEDAQQTQEDVNVSINNQLVGAVEDWNANIEVVETGYGLAVTKATPALHWLGTLADRIFVNMGWFASIYFLIGLVSVLMLILSKSGLSRSIGAASRRK